MPRKGTPLTDAEVRQGFLYDTGSITNQAAVNRSKNGSILPQPENFTEFADVIVLKCPKRVCSRPPLAV